MKRIKTIALMALGSIIASSAVAQSNVRDTGKKSPPLAIGGQIAKVKDPDEKGPQGIVAQMGVLTPSSSDYSDYHGHAMIQKRGYIWGGNLCDTKPLTPHEVALLSLAMQNNYRIAPRFRPGKENRKCLVGFSLAR